MTRQRAGQRGACVALLSIALAVGGAGCLPGSASPGGPASAPPSTLSPAEQATGDAVAFGSPPSGALAEAGRLSLGETAPPFSLDSLNGGTLSLADFAGRPLLINFWATWCAPCVEELPLLAGAAAQYDVDGLAVLLVDVGEEIGVVQAFVEERGLELPVAMDYNNAVSHAYRVGGYPTSVLIDAQGRVVDLRRGAFTDGEDLRQALASILP